MNGIADLRRTFEGLNRKSFRQRLASAERIETWIRETLNERGVLYNGTMLKSWQKCDGIDDRSFKRDAFHEYNGTLLYNQIKWRQPDSGGDIEAAVIQPFYSLKTFLEVVKQEPEKLDKHVWARDFKFDGHFYSCLNKTWDVLRIVNYKAVRSRMESVLKEWCRSGENLTPEYGNNTFRSSEFDGLMLKCFRDRGSSGFDAGQAKICCYFPVTVFEDKDVQLLSMIDPPVYLFEAA